MVLLLLMFYTWAVAHYSMSAVITFQRPIVESETTILIELWGQLYEYKVNG